MSKARSALESDHEYQLLPVLERDMHPDTRDDFLFRLDKALRDFPELEGRTVTVGRLKPSKEYFRGDPLAAADPYNLLIYAPHDERTRNTTIYHELAHLAVHVRNENGEDLPHTSEPFTSIYATAKMDSEKIDADSITYLGKPNTPQSEWPTVCQRALEYREDHRNYIQKCREWLQI